MPQAKRARVWLSFALAAAAVTAISAAAAAKESSESVKEAEQYVAKGDLKAAEIELKNAIRQSPQDPILRARLAQVYLQLGDAGLAEREARAARERNGDEADYLPILADALLQQQKFADIPDQIRPGDRPSALESKVRTALGAAAVALGDRQKAEAMWRDAIRLDPPAAEPKVQLARFLTKGKPNEADKLIDEAIAANPRSAEVLQVKGEMLQVGGNPDGAMRLFDEALKIDPKHLPAHLSRANVNIAVGNFPAADEDLDPILKATPKHIIANYLRAVELAKKHQYGDADRILDRISPAFSKVVGGYYIQGATKLALGQLAQAESLLGKYLARVPDDQSAARLMASAALQQRAANRAIDYLKPYVEKPTVDAATLSMLGNAYMAASKPEVALRQFERAATLDPQNASLKARVAITELSPAQTQEGLAQLEQVFVSEGGAAIAGPTLVLSELRANRVEKAVEVAASLIKLDASNPLY